MCDNEYLKKAFIDVFFLTKILNLKSQLIKLKDYDINNLKNLDNFYYVIKIKLEKESIIIVSYYLENKEFKFFENLKYKTDNLYEIFYIINNFLDLNTLNINNIDIIWKNQYLVSPLIDYFTGGLIFNIPKSWYSINKNLDEENELNKKIYRLESNWLKIYGNNKLLENKINYIKI
jgi:hypothetical protein